MKPGSLENLSAAEIVQIFESAGDGVIVLDTELIITYVNASAENILLRKRENILGLKFRDAFPEAKDSIFEEKYNLALKEKSAFCFKTYFDKSPYENWYEVKVCPVQNGILVFFNLISEKIRYAATLKTIFDVAPIGIGLVIERVFVDVNPCMEKIFGYSRKDFIGKSALMIYPDKEEFDRVGRLKYPNVKQGGIGSLEATFLRSNGETFTGLLSSEAVNPQDLSQGVMFTLLDISERVKAEQLLRESEKKIKELLAMLPIGVYECDLEGKIHLPNKAAALITGYDQEELENKLVWELLASGAARDCFPDFFKKLIAEQPEPQSYYGLNRKKDGALVKVQVDWDYKRRANGEISGFVCAITDITQRLLSIEREKQLAAMLAVADMDKKNFEELKKAYAQLTATQAQLIQAEKLAGVGVLAAGVAHELNSPLAGIISLLKTYIKRAKDPVDLENLNLMLEASDHMAKIVRDLTSFARESKGDYAEFDVNDIIEKTLNFSGNFLVEAGIKIIREFFPGALQVKADKSQLQQVFLNFITNARDAMPKGGELKIRTGFSDDGKFIVTEFQDSGSGLTEEMRKKVFDPFFTTKGPGSGVGLGLFVAHKIITNHNGRIFADNNPAGPGALFRIELPVLEEKNEKV